MNCIEFELAAEIAVETRDALPPQGIEHLSTCADCRRSWEVQLQLNAVIADWRSMQISAGLADSVLAELATTGLLASALPGEVSSSRRSGSSGEGMGLGPSAIAESHLAHKWEPEDVWQGMPDDPNELASARVSTVYESEPDRHRKTRSLPVAPIAVAVCLMIAFAFTSRFGGNERRDLAGKRHLRTNEVVRSDGALDVSGTLTEVLSELKTEYHEMANETKAITQGMVNAIPYRVDVAALPDSEKIELLPNSDDMVRMLQPIGSRVETALGFLWNAIPSDVPSD